MKQLNMTEELFFSTKAQEHLQIMMHTTSIALVLDSRKHNNVTFVCILFSTICQGCLRCSIVLLKCLMYNILQWITKHHIEHYRTLFTSSVNANLQFLLNTFGYKNISMQVWSINFRTKWSKITFNCKMFDKELATC